MRRGDQIIREHTVFLADPVDAVLGLPVHGGPRVLGPLIPLQKLPLPVRFSPGGFEIMPHILGIFFDIQLSL
jgi:hypothetical protein